jgi:hypothetical protein
MNESDIDARLNQHGERWRAQAAHHPAIDWTRVTAPRRRRTGLAIAGVAVAAAAVVIPVVVYSGTSTHRAPTPTITPPPPPAVARRGAPPGVFFIAGRDMDFWAYGPTALGPTWGVHLPHHRAVAVAAAPSGLTAYTAFVGGRCDTRITRSTFDPSRGEAGHTGQSRVLTIQGRAARTPMAVSPDGRTLAMVLTPSETSAAPDGPVCTGAQQILLYDLANRRIIARSDGYRAANVVDHLQFSPDGRELAFRVTGPGGSITILGTHVLELGHRVLDRYVGSPQVLPLKTVRNAPYGPVFWWHGQLVAFFNTGLWTLDGDGGISKEVAAHLPFGVRSVSSDPTGDHLLMSTSAGVTYRWDRGLLTRLPLSRPQASW